MQPGRASRTAVMVCAARAAADGGSSVARFSDPVALSLLPDDARAKVERFRSGADKAAGMRGRFAHEFLDRRAKMMVARTVAIDDAVRAAAHPQLVILGAGLDGRAWRMPELRDVTVFEVDHPDSQRDKRARVAALPAVARDIRFVAVDFARDGQLDEALAAAGHDAARPTTWIWEGVVMYLTPAEVEATLAVVGRRSAPGSRLVVMYAQPALMMRLVGLVVRRLGEPFRSAYSPDQMRALLHAHGFAVLDDQGLPAIGAALAEDVGRATRVMKHLRIVVAER